MKKNKKYWKKEYKALSELYYDLEDSLDQYAMSNIILRDQVEQLENELDKYKHSKSTTTTSGSWPVTDGFGTGKTTTTNTNYQVWSKTNRCPCGCNRK